MTRPLLDDEEAENVGTSGIFFVDDEDLKAWLWCAGFLQVKETSLAKLRHNGDEVETTVQVKL